MLANHYLLTHLNGTMRATSSYLIILSCSLTIAAAPTQEMPTQAAKPVTYYDTSSGITLLVESDRRHVVATNSRNEKIWRVDPFSDSKLTPYRTAIPVIVYMGPIVGRADILANERTATIRFNSTQFGKIDLGTGHFVLLGQD